MNKTKNKEINKKTMTGNVKNYGNGLHVFYRTIAVVVFFLSLVLFVFVLLVKGLS